MNGTKLRFYIDRQPWALNRLAVYVRAFFSDTAGGGTHAIARPLIFDAQTREQLEAATYEPNPTLMMEPEDAQQLIDELWRAGLRPTEGTGSAGSLAATERHLADMRALVFKTKPGV